MTDFDSTDDERALWAIIDDERRGWVRIGSGMTSTLAEKILAAGFRRSEVQGEPSDAQVRAIWDALGPAITVAFEYEELRAALRAARVSND